MVLLEDTGLAASTHHEASQHQDAFSITEDRERKVQFIRNVLGDVTFLKVEVNLPYRDAFEHKQVAVYDAKGQLVGRDHISGGTVSWRLSGNLVGQLSIRIEPEDEIGL
ncbi:hypothetical protein C2W62_47700 [Candidatus Entotheonella serta]|nr:hypothetical protein C2W62_47700 [Candidatus Entotheonella serta]